MDSSEGPGVRTWPRRAGSVLLAVALRLVVFASVLVAAAAVVVLCAAVVVAML